MSIEVEQKFAVDDHREIQRRLEQLGRMKPAASSKWIAISTIRPAISLKPTKRYACAEWVKRTSSLTRDQNSTTRPRLAAKSSCRWVTERIMPPNS